MGRQQFLTRLALGRSAFLSLEESPPSEQNEPAQNGHLQRYDSRGQPNNPETELRNAEMRRAQNSILKLVGVVEEREKQAVVGSTGRQRPRSLSCELIVRSRLAQLEHEDNTGENLSLVIEAVQHSLDRIPIALMARYQIGLYDVEWPFMDAVNLLLPLKHGWRCLLTSVLSGVPAYFARAAVSVLLATSIEAVVGQLQKTIIARKQLERRDARFWYTVVDTLWYGALLAIDLVTLPLDFFAFTQLLGIRSHLPLLPSWRSLLPWETSSIHAFAWRPLLRLPILGSFCSPASLLLIWSLMHEDNDLFLGTPICSVFTSFRYPSVNAPSTGRGWRYSFIQDPLGFVLHGCHTYRRLLMKSCHWNLEARTERSGFAENISRKQSRMERPETRHHRSTALAHLPAVHLATRLDLFMQRLLVLPFQSLVYRAVAKCFLTNVPDAPVTSLALVQSNGLFMPFGGGPLRSLIFHMSPNSLWRVGQYCNKIALCLAFQLGIDVCLFAVSYGMAKWYGVRKFGWGTLQEAGLDAEDPPESLLA